MADSQGKPGKLSSLSVHSVYEKESMVRGHHVYQNSWIPVMGEMPAVERVENNQHDDYVVAVTKNGDIIGHVPHPISRVSWFFSETWRSYNVSDLW